MLIVDSQVHIWESGKPVYLHRQVPSYTAGELLRDMDAAGVTGALLHPPSWDPRANEVALEAARAHPDRLAVLGFFDVSKPESRKLVAGWNSQPGMRGLRFAFLKPGEETWLTDGTADWLWPEAEKAGVPVGLLCPGKTKAVGAIAAKHPRLRLLIDHMARPRHAQDEKAFADLPDLLALARYPNVAVKASGAPGYSSAPWPYRNIHPYLKQIFDAFGPARMFWGTDITRMPCSWRQCVTMFTEELPWLKGKDLELVMGRGLCEWIRWDVNVKG
jgi:predicted TIM-barrel fold metal-dependent hydrolase